MNFVSVEKAFYRAFIFSFSKKRILATSFALFLSGLIFLFFQVVTCEKPSWFLFSWYFFPYFCSLFFLSPLGVLLCKSYAYEVQNKKFSWKKAVQKSWERLLSASLISVPFVLAFLVLWVGLGVFVALQQVPPIQELINALLSFVPFFLIMGVLLLMVSSVVLLFSLVPTWAFQEKKVRFSLSTFFAPLQKKLLSHLVLGGIGLVPFSLLYFLLNKTVFLTQIFFQGETSFITSILQGFILILVSSVLLSLGVVFFFHMAVEAFSLRIKS